MADPESFKVRHGTTVLVVYPWKHSSGEIHWRWKDRDGKHHTRKDRKKAKTDAFEMAKRQHEGTVDLNALPEHVRHAIQRMLKAGLNGELADEFLSWKALAHPEKSTAAAVDEFIAIKEANRGRSIQNVRSLRTRLARLGKHFGDRSLSTITAADLEAFLAAQSVGNRTRFNLRGSIVTFFRWCVKAGHLKSADAATSIEKPIISRKIPETWSPAEMAKLLDGVRPQYVGWLAACAFGGFRSDEVSPIPGGDKSPLDWSDFKWDRDIVIVRPETDKNGHRRIVPILPALRAYLQPIKKDAGPVCAAPPPHKLPNGKGAMSETTRLGKLVGGWKKNAIRHSWISYRAAEVGLAQAAMEAGNSEKEARKSYNDAKSKEEAAEWFALRPRRTPEN